MTANWHPDPTGEHELRYWDGRIWTEHVANQGVQSVSPLPTVAPATQQATEQQATEQPVAEQRVAEQPVVEQSVVEQQAAEQPVAEQQASVEQTADPTVAESYGVGDDPFAARTQEMAATAAAASPQAAATETADVAEAAPVDDALIAATPVDHTTFGPDSVPASSAVAQAEQPETVQPEAVTADDIVADELGEDATAPADEAETVVEDDVTVVEDEPSIYASGNPLTAGPIEDTPFDVEPTVAEAEATPDVDAPAAAATGAAGITGDLIDGRFAEVSGDGVTLQNARMLRAHLGEPFLARQGSMVAYQGDVTFAYQGSGAAKFLKKAVTGEGLSLMRVEGQGDVFLADSGKHVHVLQLNDSGISVNGASVLAFSTSLDWNVERVKGGSIAAGGLFNTLLRGTGWVAITTDGDPVVLDAGEAATYADSDAIVAWSADLETSLKSSMTAAGAIGRGSGEAVQVAFTGQGFVIIQPSEGPYVNS